MPFLSPIKNALLPFGRTWRTIRLGAAKGIRMQLDLRNQSQRYWGLDERELFGPLRELMPDCRSMVDVGANDGYYTLMFLRSPAEHVVACEPGPVLRLLENVSANGFQTDGRFQIVNKEIGPGDGQMPLNKVIHHLPGPILIKLDVEGAELAVIQGVGLDDRLSDLRWIVETHSAELEANCLRWFADHGFMAKVIPNAWWRCVLPETRLVAHNRWIVALPKSASKQASGPPK